MRPSFRSAKWPAFEDAATFIGPLIGERLTVHRCWTSVSCRLVSLTQRRCPGEVVRRSSRSRSWPLPLQLEPPLSNAPIVPTPVEWKQIHLELRRTKIHYCSLIRGRRHSSATRRAPNIRDNSLCSQMCRARYDTPFVRYICATRSNP